MGTKRTISVELEFLGSDRIVERPRGVFRGGVPDPELGPAFGFNVLPTAEDELGGLVPVALSQSYAGSLQVNLWGTAEDFRALGRYLLAIAELDTSADPGFHQHHDELVSADGRCRVDLIVRKLLT